MRKFVEDLKRHRFYASQVAYDQYFLPTYILTILSNLLMYSSELRMARPDSATSVRSTSALRNMQTNRVLFAALLFDRLAKEEKRMRLDWDAATCREERAQRYGPLMKCRDAILRVLLYPRPPACPEKPFMRPGVGGMPTQMLVTDAIEVPPPADSGT